MENSVKEKAEIIHLSKKSMLDPVPFSQENSREDWDIQEAEISNISSVQKRSFLQKVQIFWYRLPRLVQAFFYTFFLILLVFPLTAFVGWIEVNVAPYLMRALVDTVNWASGSLFPILQEVRPEHSARHIKHLHKIQSYPHYFMTNIFPVFAMMGLVFFLIRNVMLHIFMQEKNLNIFLTVLFAPVSYFFLLHLLHIR